jgi:MFS family permease
MLGAKIGALFGSRSVFRATVALFGAATMTLSPSANMMIAAQGIAGFAAAALVPTLVVLIATNYKGRYQSQALGWLAAEAMAGVLAFLVAGSLSAWIGWRYSCARLVVLAGGFLALSRELKPVASESDMRIEGVGTVLAPLAVITWGLLLARPAAPVGLLGLSPAPLKIVVGTALGQAFFAWSNKPQAAQKTPLLAWNCLRRHSRGQWCSRCSSSSHSDRRLAV